MLELLTVGSLVDGVGLLAPLLSSHSYHSKL